MKSTAGRGGRAWKLILGIVCLLALVFLIGSSPFFPWTPFNCWHYDVDMRTGKIRYTRYILYCRTKTEIKDSALSLALFPEERTNITPEWRRVHTFSPGMRNSPHYLFHGALVQIRLLEMLWDDAKFTPNQKRKVAQDVLALWAYGEDDYLAGRYLNAFWPLDQMSENQQAEFLKKLEDLNICERSQIGGITEFTARYPDGTLLERHHVRITENGKQIPHGQYVVWNRDKNAGEAAIFENGNLVQDWHSITNYPE